MNKHRSALRFVPRLETLEGRSLPSISASIDVTAYAQDQSGNGLTDESQANPGSAAESSQVGAVTVSAQSAGSYQLSPLSLTGTANISANEQGISYSQISADGEVSFSGTIEVATSSAVAISATPQFSFPNSVYPYPAGGFLISLNPQNTPAQYLVAYDTPPQYWPELATISGEQFSFTQNLTAGTYAYQIEFITIAQAGSNPTGPQAGSLTFNVTEVPQTLDTTTALSATPNPSTFGQPVTLAATVSPTTSSQLVPTGTVDFMDGSTDLGTATLNNSGTATLTISALPIGLNSIKAVYSGDSYFNTSTSSTSVQTVNKADTTTVATSPSSVSMFGQPVTFTATISANTQGVGTPSGSVDFVDTTTNTDLGSATISNGTASVTTAALLVSTHSVTANYGGDATYNKSSGSTALTVISASVSPSPSPPVLPAITVNSVSTTDSRSLTVDYDISNQALSAPLTIGFYRSATSYFDPQNDVLLGTVTDPDIAVGSHEDMLQLPNGLQPNTILPYVLAVADPYDTLTGISRSQITAEFRTYVLGVVAVGFDPSSIFTSVPASWVQDMVNALVTTDGYLSYSIPFTWDSAEPSPQAIIDAGQTLFDEIELVATGIPNLQPNDVIDVHLIGHSRGTVIVSEAIQDLISQSGIVPQMDHGYFKMTLLDPHPANLLDGFNASSSALNSFPPNGVAAGLLAGYLGFEEFVADPPVIVPPRVNEVDVLYEKTPTSMLSLIDNDFPEAFLNLQGLSLDDLGLSINQNATLTLQYNLTGPRLGHSEVHDYYLKNAVLNGNLGDDKPLVFLPPMLPVSQFSGDVTISGITNSDSLLVGQTAGGGIGSLSYSLNEGSPLPGENVTSLTFDGLGNDTLTVLIPASGAIVAGNINFNGGPGSNTLVIDASGQTVQVEPNSISVGDPQTILFSNVFQININNATAVNTIAGPDTTDRAVALSGLTVQERWVQTLYLDELGRPGLIAELDSWLPLLTGTGGQTAVAAAIMQSAEARTHLVQAWYEEFLGRPAANGEEQVWVNQLLQGQTEELVVSSILGSPEFFVRAESLISAGTAQERYVKALYQVLLNHTANSEEVAGWVTDLSQFGLAGVALGMQQSLEFRTDLFEGYYNALLHRVGDTRGLLRWVYSNLDASAVRRQFEASAEFFVNG